MVLYVPMLSKKCFYMHCPHTYALDIKIYLKNLSRSILFLAIKKNLENNIILLIIYYFLPSILITFKSNGLYVIHMKGAS